MNSGSEINRGVFIGAVAIVVVIACIVGYFIIAPPKANMDEATKKQYMEHMKQSQTAPAYPGPGYSAGPGAGSPYERMSQSGGPSSGGAPASGGAPTSGGTAPGGGQ
jgi:hypothetical protein